MGKNLREPKQVLAALLATLLVVEELAAATLAPALPQPGAMLGARGIPRAGGPAGLLLPGRAARATGAATRDPYASASREKRGEGLGARTRRFAAALSRELRLAAYRLEYRLRLYGALLGLGGAKARGWLSRAGRASARGARTLERRALAAGRAALAAPDRPVLPLPEREDDRVLARPSDGWSADRAPTESRLPAEYGRVLTEAGAEDRPFPAAGSPRRIAHRAPRGGRAWRPAERLAPVEGMVSAVKYGEAPAGRLRPVSLVWKFVSATSARLGAEPAPAPAARPAAPGQDADGISPLQYRTVGVRQRDGKEASGEQVLLAYDKQGTLRRVCGVGVGETVKLADGRSVRRDSDQKVTLTDAAGAEQTFEAPASPLAFDLGETGIATRRETARFDIDGDGEPDTVHRLLRGNGLLAFDADGDGRAGADGRELFGDRTDLDGDGRPDGFADGFAALAALARRAVREGTLPERTLTEGRLDARGLAALERGYGLRMLAGFGGKALRLGEAGVVEIALPNGAGERIRDFDGKGNDLSVHRRAEFTRADGTTGVYEDVWFKPLPKGPGAV